ncbi:MAG: ABC transporter ATP-binding protein [Spirochaetales bacterium]|nr:ABC transporter ATP-binding protein [Spirochaetales bacterium]
MKENTPVLRMEGITKRFPGVTANDNIDLELYPGEVLALLGENGAGKSSLMNVLAGLYFPDEGKITVHGKKVDIRSPQDSMTLGIGMIHQEFMLVGNMTVAENIILGMKDLPLFPPMAEVKKRIRELSDRYKLKVDPNSYIQNLGVGEQQRVEILKLVYRGAEILILDEPTAVLTPEEARDLNRIIKTMLDEGKSAVFITHKMDEVMEFSHRVQILRRGKSVSVCSTKEVSKKDLARMMVGREILFDLTKSAFSPGKERVRMDKVTVEDETGRKLLKDVSINIRSGEILGIAGVAGNGQQELAEALTGLQNISSGTVTIDGMNMTRKKPIQLIKAGVSHIPADRGAMGIVGDMSVSSNLAMKKYRDDPLSHRGVLHLSRFFQFAKKMIQFFSISTPGPGTMVKFLSGGNIQKTILAREIDACRGILVAVYPSRGLDVGAIEAVRKQIIEQREKGSAVLLVSEELDELISVADTIAVMSEGEIMGIVSTKDADIEEIGMMMAGEVRSEA